jgi:5-methylcytosine-specific restriction protein B
MEILRDAGKKLSQAEVHEELRHRIQLNAQELSLDNSGLPRFDRAVGFNTGDAATIGWASKIGGWSITDAGVEALDTYETPDELWSELRRQLREVDRRRKEAQRDLDDVQQFIADAIALVEPGSWTSYEDLAELAGTTGTQVADFLAAVKVPGSYRVLNTDGSIPPEGQLHWSYRGTPGLRERLPREGLAFGDDGWANRGQRLTAAALKDRLRTRAEELQEDGAPVPAKRAWMVRGSSVDGYNLVPQWLHEGFISLSASQLAKLEPDCSYDELRQAVDEGYQHKSYAYREQRLAEFDRFLRRVRPGDSVLTTMQGEVYVGEVTGRPVFADSEHGLSNLRRAVHWHNNSDQPIPGDRLSPPVPALLQDQAHVVDLTEAYEQIEALIAPLMSEPTAPPTRKELAFPPVAAQFAYDLYLERDELARIADLLWERKQVILYGPPGTGKTWLARKLARHLTSDMDGAVQLVQFHPSYTYEDFFEGFRPQPGGGGSLSFELRPGPFRAFAESAEADTSTPYILVIDEINRANLAKVFGELYFLLEYRDESIRLQYSPNKPFRLPPNLFIIGTMNTADRSIARIDSAMRRRFGFVELHPRVPPVQGLLARWLARNGLPDWPARVLDQLNARIEDADSAIGPSYLMNPRIYQREDGIERVWQYSIMPLLTDLFYGQTDLEDRYGLAALRRAAGVGETSQQETPDSDASPGDADEP